jgi:Tol biopolymer transport system component
MSGDGKNIVFSETGEAEGSNYSIFLRKTDGSPAVRLGEGGFGALSPDGQWVLAGVGSPAKLTLLPTGVGESRQLTDNKNDHFNYAWTPDSKSIVFSSAESGHAPRTYLLEIDGGTPRAITPEDITGAFVSPDGKFLLCIDGKRQRWLYPIAGGQPQKLNLVLNPNERIMGFFPDGKSVRVRATTVPVQITRMDIATGRRETWKEIAPADPAGVQSIPVIRFSTDGKSYAYSVGRILSDLYVVDGLK